MFVVHNNNSFDKDDLVIICNQKTDDIPWVRRIIGLPSEEIYWNDKNIFSKEDLQLMRIKYPNAHIKNDKSYNKLRLGNDQYFIISDNAGGIDSKNFGPIYKKDIIGKVFFIL